MDSLDGVKCLTVGKVKGVNRLGSGSLVTWESTNLHWEHMRILYNLRGKNNGTQLSRDWRRSFLAFRICSTHLLVLCLVCK